MIVSKTCRHGTEARIGRNDIGRELMALSRYVPTITRAQAVFSKETHHRNSEDLDMSPVYSYTKSKAYRYIRTPVF